MKAWWYAIAKVAEDLRLTSFVSSTALPADPIPFNSTCENEALSVSRSFVTLQILFHFQRAAFHVRRPSSYVVQFNKVKHVVC